jgi:hypothetical protein
MAKYTSYQEVEAAWEVERQRLIDEALAAGEPEPRVFIRPFEPFDPATLPWREEKP